MRFDIIWLIMYSEGLKNGNSLPNFAKPPEKCDFRNNILKGLAKFGLILKRPVPL